MIYAFIKKGSFQDSVSLMIISRKLSERPEVDQVSVMMGTPANKSMLESTGFWHPDFAEATPNDICVAVRTQEAQPEILDLIREQLEKELSAIANASGSSTQLVKARRWESACQKLPDANLLLVSVAGEYAAGVAKEGLLANKSVMLFSDNVPLEQEVELKTLAREKGLIVMGPDCGTAMIAGSPLAFANVLPQGGIGVIGASGTGIQEITSQVALHQQGISHAIGLGGRDLSAEVGGISALTALEMLAADSATQVIAFVSKPPSPQVRARIIAAMQKQNKPVVALFLGSRAEQRREGNVWLAKLAGGRRATGGTADARSATAAEPTAGCRQGDLWSVRWRYPCRRGRDAAFRSSGSAGQRQPRRRCDAGSRRASHCRPWRR